MRATQSIGARFTMGIAGLTVLAFGVATIVSMEGPLAYAAGFIPARFSHPDLLVGADLGFPVIPFFLTPLSSALLHGGWLHLFFNMLMFVFCGRQVEMVLGGRLLALLYGVGAYAAALGQWVLGPDEMSPMIGASGAISAIVGAYSLLFSNQEVKPIGPIPANIVRMLWLGAGWVFLQFLVGVASGLDGGALGAGNSGIAIGAHIGGFLAGMLLTRPLLKARFRKAAIRVVQ